MDSAPLDPIASPCSFQQLRAITIPVRLIEEVLRKPTAYPYFKGMFVRVRLPSGYSLMRIDEVHEGEVIETYKDSEFISVITASFTPGISKEVRLCVISSTPPKITEYDSAKAAGNLPNSEEADHLRAVWDSEAVRRPNDVAVVSEMLRLQQKIQSISTRPNPNQNIVAEKVYLEQMLKIDWPEAVAEEYRQRLQEISGTANKFIQERAATIEEYVQKTQANKSANRRCRRDALASPSTAHKGKAESSFWELCENDGQSGEQVESATQDEPQTQVMQTQPAPAYKPVLQCLHEAIQAEPLENILEQLI